MSPDNVFIIDGIVSTPVRRNVTMRWCEILQMDATKVIEHPDIFIRETEYTLEDFDVIIELRNHPEEKSITTCWIPILRLFDAGSKSGRDEEWELWRSELS